MTQNEEVIRVDEATPAAGQTLQEANRDGYVHEDVLVIAIERDGRVLTASGDTVFEAGDRVKIYPPVEIPTATLQAFRSPMEGSTFQ